MKKFSAKLVVQPKPLVKDIKGQTLKRAIESLVSVENLSCTVGSYYYFEFIATNQVEALSLVTTIADELLTNDIAETYEIRCLDEVEESCI